MHSPLLEYLEFSSICSESFVKHLRFMPDLTSVFNLKVKVSV